MSRFFPHTPYAEDQPLAAAILTTHVLTRAIQAGSLVGLGIAGVRAGVSRLWAPGPVSVPGATLPASSPTSASTATTAATSPPKVTPSALKPQLPLTTRLLLGSGTGTVVALALLSVGLVGRMRGREDIEWRDRAWRLMENEGQLENDDWAYAGMVGGLAALGLSGKRIGATGWRPVVGAIGAGSVVGMVGYMGWRYGIRGGKFPEKKEMPVES
jgi:hypothetical protein